MQHAGAAEAVQRISDSMGQLLQLGPAAFWEIVRSDESLMCCIDTYLRFKRYGQLCESARGAEIWSIVQVSPMPLWQAAAHSSDLVANAGQGFKLQFTLLVSMMAASANIMHGVCAHMCIGSGPHAWG